jgi:hypothetical protein
MSIKRENRTAPLGLRITPALKEALEQAAADDQRPVASYVEKLLIEHLSKKGYFTRTK